MTSPVQNNSYSSRWDYFKAPLQWSTKCITHIKDPYSRGPIKLIELIGRIAQLLFGLILFAPALCLAGFSIGKYLFRNKTKQKTESVIEQKEAKVSEPAAKEAKSGESIPCDQISTTVKQSEETVITRREIAPLALQEQIAQPASPISSPVLPPPIAKEAKSVMSVAISQLPASAKQSEAPEVKKKHAEAPKPEATIQPIPQKQQKEKQTIIPPFQILPAAFGNSSCIQFKSGDALQKMRQELLSRQTIPISEAVLCEYLARIPVNLAGKKICMLSMMQDGFGDSVFGLKALTILQRHFPGATCHFVTNKHEKALKVNGPHDHSFLIPHYCFDAELGNDTVLEMVQKLAADFLLVAPVLSVERKKIDEVAKKCPNLFINEYGFERSEHPMQLDDYTSGAGPNQQGILIHGELQKWAESRPDELTRLKELRHFSVPLCQHVLGSEYSEEAIKKFSTESELFLGYGRNVHACVEFILAVTKMHKDIDERRNLCFVLLGEGFTKKEEAEMPYKELGTFGINKIIYCNNIDETNPEVREVILDPTATKQIKIIFAQLMPEEVIPLVKASQAEMLTTGDQSWGEGVSGHKHWMQQYLVHKRKHMKTLIEWLNSKEINEIFRTHMIDIYTKARHPFKVVADRWQQQAKFFTEARTNPAVREAWFQFNSFLCNKRSIENWLVGMVIKRYKEHHDPQFRSQVSSLLKSSEAPSEELLAVLERAMIS